MTKRELAVRIADETGLTQVAVKEVIQRFLDYVVEVLAQGETAEFRNFGVFKCVYRKPRIGRNPQKPENMVKIPGRYVVRFKPGKEMKAKMAKLRPEK
jgi:nucleoid DNA-binding protein